MIDREKSMETVKISPKFQVVIPKKVRESLQLKRVNPNLSKGV